MHHSTIADSGITNDLKISFLADLHVFGEKVVLGNANVGKEHIAIFFCVETELRANISSSNSRHPIIIGIFDLNQERINTLRLSIDDGLSEYHGIVGKERKLSRPVLGSTKRGCVNDPFLSLGVKVSCGL
jgi:hypothetical protein